MQIKLFLLVLPDMSTLKFYTKLLIILLFLFSCNRKSDQIKQNSIPDSLNLPLKRVVCMSTSHISFVKALGADSTIIAVSGSKYIYDSVISNRVSKGEILDIGYESSLNYELLLSLQPDLVFTYGISGENNSYIDKLNKLGVKTLVINDYKESHPIKKLEYIKLFGKLLGKEQLADSIYNYKKIKYDSLSNLTKNLKTRKKVLINAPWKEVWYIPGDDSYMNKLILDAGGEVLGVEKNSVNVSNNNFETIFKLAFEADIWLNPNNFTSITDLKNSNELFKQIPALNSGLVYNNNKRRTQMGGSDFFEKGVLEPEEILADLIAILHPEIIKNRKFKYYIKLE